jgi:hypothetical protein
MEKCILLKLIINYSNSYIFIKKNKHLFTKKKIKIMFFLNKLF